MMLFKLNYSLCLVSILLMILIFCWPIKENLFLAFPIGNKAIVVHDGYRSIKTIKIDRDITVEVYFQFMDSLIEKYDPLTSYNLSEHLLVRVNTWIIDMFQNTDYYRMKAHDSFIYNQKKMVVLPKGSIIKLPDSIQAKEILQSFKNTLIDVNIPEFKLRIYESVIERYEFPIRVGRNEKKYLKMAGRTIDLKTKTGKGIIVNHVKNPDYYNPANGHRYFVTKRDDDEVTKLPQIPFLVTEINGVVNGQLIHPTTNPLTLGKAYSNGCIGTNEADAWVIYYYAPIGTQINIRYDLNVIDKNGEQIVLKDIYNYNNTP